MLQELRTDVRTAFLARLSAGELPDELLAGMLQEGTCIRSIGKCWKKCSRCCKPNTPCLPSFCHNACYAPGCKAIVNPPPKPSLPPKPSPPPKKCSWTCKPGFSSTCYLRCRKCCNSKGVCTISNVCDRRCYSAGCGLPVTDEATSKAGTVDFVVLTAA